MVRLIEESAKALELECIRLPSGAFHDALYPARVCPAGMIFIPCRDGKSHAPEEWTEKHQVAAGAAALYEAVRLLDGQNQ